MNDQPPQPHQPAIPLVPPAFAPAFSMPLVAPATDAAQPKPEISQLTANYQVHVAGLSAEAAARQAGADPASAAVLLNAAVGGIQIAGYQFPAIQGGFILMLPMLQKSCANSVPLGNESGNLMAMAHALAFPEPTWQMLRDSTNASGFEESVFAFARNLSVPDLRRLGKWINGELERMNADADDKQVGKP